MAKNLKTEKIVRNRGFSLVEILLVVMFMGIIAGLAVPAINNAGRVRALESAAKGIISDFQKVKFQAVKTKRDHRIRFFQEGNTWCFMIEIESSTGIWSQMNGSFKKQISENFNSTINLPNQEIVFSPFGIISNYSSTQNDITVQSPVLLKYGQNDVRKVTIFPGGSFQYDKAKSI